MINKNQQVGWGYDHIDKRYCKGYKQAVSHYKIIDISIIYITHYSIIYYTMTILYLIYYISV